VRRRNEILGEMKELVQGLVESWPDKEALQDLDIPSFLHHRNAKDKSLPADAPKVMMVFVEKFQAMNTLSKSQNSSMPSSPVEDPTSSRKSKKRRKLASGGRVDVLNKIDVSAIATRVRELYQKHSSLFEWCDGPLVTR